MAPTAPPGHRDTGSDYDNLDDMGLDPPQLELLIAAGGECVFNWTTRDGYPMGVVVRYVYRAGAFWTTSVDTRTRLKALQVRAQSTVVLNRDGHSATFKGDSVLHRPGDPDWDTIKAWFFPAFAGTDRKPHDAAALLVERSLETPHQVIVETPAQLVVSFDFTKLAARAQTHPDTRNP
jgi:hypothetical protein